MQTLTFVLFISLVSGLVFNHPPEAAAQKRASANGLFEQIEQANIDYFQSGIETSNGSYWSILALSHPDETRILVKNEETGAVFFDHPLPSGGLDKFLTLHLVEIFDHPNPILILRFTRGVHGEQIYLLDPANPSQPSLYHRTFSWPVEIDTGQDAITFILHEEDPDKDGGLITTKILWKSEKQIVETREKSK